MRRTMCTASGAPRGPARRARRSAWWTRRARSRSSPSRSSSPRRSRWTGPRTTSTSPRSSRRARSGAATRRRSASAWPRGAAAGADRGARVAAAAVAGAAPAAALAASPLSLSPEARGQGEGRQGMTSPRVDLTLPAEERDLAASLAATWRDLLYVPGPGLTSPLDPGAYRSSLVVIRGDGAAIRVTSRVMPAFGADLSRLVLELVAPQRPDALGETLGSFFDPAHTGTIYALTPDRTAGAARLGQVARVRVVREHGRGADAAWTADRGLALTAADGTECLVLAVSEPAEVALFLPLPGLYRALIDGSTAPQPGVTVRDLLGHAEREDDVNVTVTLHPL